MKLTIKQLDALQILIEEKSIPKLSCKIHNNTLNSLYVKNLVCLRNYANGEFWEITDLGLNNINKL